MEDNTKAPVVRSLAHRLTNELGDAGIRERLQHVAAEHALPSVRPDTATGLYRNECAVPTMFRFGDKRTYLEHAALVSTAKSNATRRLVQRQDLVASLENAARDRVQRLAALDEQVRR